MSDDPAKERLNRPFHVRTTSGSLLETFDVEGQAAAAARVANEKAEALGIEARYEVVPK